MAVTSAATALAKVRVHKRCLISVFKVFKRTLMGAMDTLARERTAVALGHHYRQGYG